MQQGAIVAAVAAAVLIASGGYLVSQAPQAIEAGSSWVRSAFQRPSRGLLPDPEPDTDTQASCDRLRGFRARAERLKQEWVRQRESETDSEAALALDTSIKEADAMIAESNADIAEICE